ncbi:MAG: LPS export ABC transporter permease LptF [Gammaproteobacteria bacterium]|nr:LPS export ABC transporter permease LptF [Gammaproteobacteria bacterium]
MLIIRYLSTELFKTTLAVLLFLFLVVLSHRLVWVLSEASTGEFGRELILTILAMQIPKFFSILLPAGFAFSILLTLNRLASHHEMTSIHMSGFSERQIFHRLGGLSLLIFGMTAVFSLWLSPWAVSFQEKLKLEHAHTLSKSLVNPGRFQQILGRSDWVVYVREWSEVEKALQQVIVLKATVQNEEDTEVLMAEKGYFAKEQEEENRYLSLKNGFRYEGKLGAKDFRTTQFETLMVPIKMGSWRRSSKRSAQPTPLLWRSSDKAAQGELYWRLSLPTTAPILILLMLPFVRLSERKERMGRTFMAVLLVIFYYNMLILGRSWIEQERFSLLQGFGLIHGLFLGIGLILWIHPLQWAAFRKRFF